MELLRESFFPLFAAYSKYFSHESAAKADKSNMRKLTVLLLVLIASQCDRTLPGFAFAAIDDREMTALQKRWYQPGRFVRHGGPQLFEEKQAIWVSYKPAKINYKRAYAISLSKKSLGWIEIDLKNMMLSPDSDFLVNNFGHLEKGKYLLRVAFDNEILDSILFEIINESDQMKDYIDYDAPLSVVLDDTQDDIRLYSR